MSKADWYGGYGYIPNKDNIDENILKKEALQKKFIQMCSIKTSEDKMQVDKKIVSENGTREFKSKSKKRCDETATFKKTIKILNKEIAKIKKEQESLKEDNYKLKMINKSKETEIKTLHHDISELYSEIKDLENENKLLMESLHADSIIKLKKELSTIKCENIKLKKNHEAIKGDLRVATKQLQNYQINRTGEYEGNLVKRYKQRLKEKEAEIHGLRSKYINAMAAINELSFKVIRKQESFILKKKTQLNKKVASANSSCIIADECDDKEILFGVISLNKECQLTFADLNNKKYPISENNNHQVIRSNVGMPVRAVKGKDEECVFIECIYYNLNKDSKSQNLCNTKEMRLRKNASVKSFVSGEFKGKKVLLIGSKYKDKYVRALENMGAKVIWHEAFSDNESRIEDRSSSADVVIVCTSHISHSVIYKLESLYDYVDNPKYQLLEWDNVTNIIGRTRYSIVNQGI